MVLFSRSSQHGPDLIRPVDRMGSGVFLFGVGFGLSGAINPVELQETGVSVGQNPGESLPLYLFSAFSNQQA
jgi:hypothetical protein